MNWVSITALVVACASFGWNVVSWFANNSKTVEREALKGLKASLIALRADLMALSTDIATVDPMVELDPNALDNLNFVTSGAVSGSIPAVMDSRREVKFPPLRRRVDGIMPHVAEALIYWQTYKAMPVHPGIPPWIDVDSPTFNEDEIDLQAVNEWQQGYWAPREDLRVKAQRGISNAQDEIEACLNIIANRVHGAPIPPSPSKPDPDETPGG
ncbi:hypothetical protein [Tsukamurella strandjordii]|uniref:Uncharacterized protein n=1 Tax=Tsukamurella strandjordii TaxID=147577 RepID=A0AA90NH24_9ACTN|nr:hypothetical protein [Tsukamurella strandjordii]MDP0398923.1 hypothetical protein [Tsukamurella strandjordii]